MCLFLVLVLIAFLGSAIKTHIDLAISNPNPIHDNIQPYTIYPSDEVQDSDLAIEDIRNCSDTVNRDNIERCPLKDNEPRFSIRWYGGYKRDFEVTVSETIKKAYHKIGSDLNHYPESETTVMLYLNGNIRDASKSLSWRPVSWIRAAYDGENRIRIEDPLDTLTLQRVLLHEYTHVVVDSITQGNCPTWLHEGLAMYEEGDSEVGREPILALAIRHNALIPLSSLDGSFLALGENLGQLAYTESISAVEYLIDAYGLDKVQEILKLLSTNSSMDFALRKAINLGYSEFEDEWQEKLIRKYRG